MAVFSHLSPHHLCVVLSIPFLSTLASLQPWLHNLPTWANVKFPYDSIQRGKTLENYPIFLLANSTLQGRMGARAGTESITRVYGQRKGNKMKTEEMVLPFFGSSEPLIYIIASP